MNLQAPHFETTQPQGGSNDSALPPPSSSISANLPLEPPNVQIICPRSLVGRVIGKGGTTVKGIQLFTGAVIEVDQRDEPARIIVIGQADAVNVAKSMLTDILDGKFKGFALLRQLVSSQPLPEQPADYAYAPGLGMFPRRQLHGNAIAHAASEQQQPQQQQHGGDQNGGLINSTSSISGHASTSTRLDATKHQSIDQATLQDANGYSNGLVGSAEKTMTATTAQLVQQMRNILLNQQQQQQQQQQPQLQPEPRQLLDFLFANGTTMPGPGSARVAMQLHPSPWDVPPFNLHGPAEMRQQQLQRQHQQHQL